MHRQQAKPQKTRNRLDAGIGQCLDRDGVPRLGERRQRRHNAVVSTAGDNDGVGGRVEAGSVDPGRAGCPVPFHSRMRLIGQHVRQDGACRKFDHRFRCFQTFDAKRRIVMVQRNRSGFLFGRARRGAPVGDSVHGAEMWRRGRRWIGPAAVGAPPAWPFCRCRVQHIGSASDFSGNKTPAFDQGIGACHGAHGAFQCPGKFALRRQAGAGCQFAALYRAQNGMGDGLVFRPFRVGQRVEPWIIRYCHGDNIVIDGDKLSTYFSKYEVNRRVIAPIS